MSRHVLPTAPSPTTTHLMACIGAAPPRRGLAAERGGAGGGLGSGSRPPPPCGWQRGRGSGHHPRRGAERSAAQRRGAEGGPRASRKRPRRSHPPGPRSAPRPRGQPLQHRRFGATRLSPAALGFQPAPFGFFRHRLEDFGRVRQRSAPLGSGRERPQWPRCRPSQRCPPRVSPARCLGVWLFTRPEPRRRALSRRGQGAARPSGGCAAAPPASRQGRSLAAAGGARGRVRPPFCEPLGPRGCGQAASSPSATGGVRAPLCEPVLHS